MTRHRTVADVMTSDVVTAEPDTTFKELARLMDGYGISGLPVVAGDGHPIGVVTRTDLLVKEGHPELEPTGPLFELPSHRAQRRKASGQVASELMTAPPVTVRAGTRLARAARRMADAEVKRLLVVDDEGRLIGIVSREDMLLVFLRADEEIRDEIVDRVILHDWLMDPDRFVVRVRDGVVSLQGRIERRSLIPSLIRVIRGVDGVVAVDARLSWDADDTVKPPGPSEVIA
jgi:CBS domain-containing protein